MKIIVAPDSFKGSNTAVRVADTIERGIRNVFPDAEIIKIPMADGGEGTVDAVVRAGEGEFRTIEVTGPLGEPVEATYGTLSGGRAVIEMAAASGLPLVPEDRKNPEMTTTYGTGELIRDAIEQGCREILVGIGGSATNDAGIGMAEALGYAILDEKGDPVGRGGGALSSMARIQNDDVHPALPETTFSVACDVQNPLFGKTGAAYVYGPQKGADQQMIERLDAGLQVFAECVERDLSVSVASIPGAGAAGGLGGGLVAFCGAELKSGIDAVLDIVRFEESLSEIDLIVTGEGAMDGSSAYGKVPVGVARRGGGVPVLAIVGDIGKGAAAVYELGINGIMSTVNRAMPLPEAMKQSTELLEDAAERAMRIVRIGMNLSG